jgi:hypothetical protein
MAPLNKNGARAPSAATAANMVVVFQVELGIEFLTIPTV